MGIRGLTRGKTWKVSNGHTFDGYTTAVGGHLWVRYPEEAPGMAYYIVRVPDGYGHPAGGETANLLVQARVPRGMFFLSAEYRLRDKPHRVFWIASHADKLRQEGIACPEGGTAVDQGTPPQFAGYPMCDLCASKILQEIDGTKLPGHWAHW